MNKLHKDLSSAIRFLSIDAVQKANSGHPGMPMGMADVATVLFKNIHIDFNQIIKIIKKEKISKKIVGGYYPVNFEVDDLELLKKFEKKNFNISLPVIKKNSQMDFYAWSFSDPLKINKYGIPEPETKNIVYPDVLLIPLVAFDKNLNRLGYGGGYYDRLIEKLSKKKNIIKIGLAISIQKIDKVPINANDQKLDYIVTNKYIIK